MKKKIFKYVSLGIAVISLLSSCDDVVNYPGVTAFSNNGLPQITAIYDAQDTACTTDLTSGSLNQMIHLKGANLSNVKSIKFNSVEVNIRSAVYAKTSESWVTIPRVIPNTITDTLTYVTDKGVTAIYFPVTIPKVSVTGLANEFTGKGKEVQVIGDNFDLYGFADTTAASPASIVITNSDSAYTQKIHADSITSSYMSIDIPKKCPENSLVTFTWQEQGKTKTKTVTYRMTKTLLFGNFDRDLGWWGTFLKNSITDGTNSGDPTSLGYKFLRIKGTYSAWSWNSDGMGFSWPSDDAAQHPENYVLKFEACTNSSYPFVNYGDNGATGSKNGGYFITFSGPSGASGIRNQFDPITTYGVINTYGHWRTFSIPLSDVLQGGITSAGSWVALEFVLQPNTNDAWTVDHSFGQFRIERANY